MTNDIKSSIAVLDKENTAVEMSPDVDLELEKEIARQKVMSKAKRKKIKKIKQNLTGWLMGGWPFFGAMLLGTFPKIMGYILPFCKVKGTNLATMQFVGFDNFVYLFTNPNSYFWKSFGVSVYYLISVPVGLAISLFVAVQLDKKIRGHKAFRVIMFLPTFVSGVAMAIFWRFFFQADTGIFASTVNFFVTLFGGEKIPIDLLNNQYTYMPSIIFTTTWGACANCVLFQAALGQVSEEMKEAARIDGASERKIFWKITFPAITPTFFYQLLMSMIGALQVFTSLQLLSNGTTGPNDAALSLVYYIYEMAFEWTGDGAGLGMATAAAIVFKFFILGLTGIVMKTSEKWVHYEN